MSSKNKGWVRLHRKIEDSPLWFAEPFTKAQAWIDLFLYANHKQAKIFIRGIEIEVKRGQLAWSEVTMAKRWKWSRKRVRNFLKYLEKEQQITQSKDRYITTLATICNYETHQKDTAEDTAEEQQKNSRGYINNNDKNDKNVNNINIPEWIPKETWDAFLEVRKAKKCPNTERALKMLIKKLDKFRAKEIDPKEAMELSIVNGWKDVYEPRKGEFIKGGNKAENLMNQNIQAGKDFITQMKKESEGLF